MCFSHHVWKRQQIVKANMPHAHQTTFNNRLCIVRPFLFNSPATNTQTNIYRTLLHTTFMWDYESHSNISEIRYLFLTTVVIPPDSFNVISVITGICILWSTLTSFYERSHSTLPVTSRSYDILIASSHTSYQQQLSKGIKDGRHGLLLEYRSLSKVISGTSGHWNSL